MEAIKVILFNKSGAHKFFFLARYFSVMSRLPKVKAASRAAYIVLQAVIVCIETPVFIILSPILLPILICEILWE